MKTKSKKILTSMLMALFIAASSIVLSACIFDFDNRDRDEENSNLTFNTSASPTQAFAFETEDTPLTREQAIENGYPVPPITASPAYTVTYSTRQATATHDSLAHFGANNTMLYPGALLNLNTMAPISVARAPLTISLDAGTWTGVPEDAPLSTVVSNPTTSTMEQGLRTLVQNNVVEGVNMSASTNWTLREFRSERDMEMTLGIGFRGFGANMQNDFSFENMTRQTNIVLELEQVFYTVRVDRPTEVSGFFADSLTNSQIRQAIPNTMVPVYVSDVVFGMRVVVSIQTNFQMTDIQNELQASFNGFGASGSVTSEFNRMMTDQSTQISSFVYGGSAAQNNRISLAAAGGDFTAILGEVFSDEFDAVHAVGQPIAFRVRHLEDGSLAGIVDSDTYTIKEIQHHQRHASWEALDQLINSGEILRMQELILDLSGLDDTTTIAARTIIIPSNLERVRLIGSNNIRQNPIIISSLSLNIATRNTPVAIELDNISFTGNNLPAITTTNIALVNLRVHGIAVLRGAANHPAVSVGDIAISALISSEAYDLTLVGGHGSNGDRHINHGHGNHGAAGLHSLRDVTITGNSENTRITIIGGNGGTGAHWTVNGTTFGTHGGHGGTGINAVRRIDITGVFHSATRITGGNGGHGTRITGDGRNHGGNGGNGGFALTAENFFMTDIHGITFVGGNGGNGATGNNRSVLGSNGGHGGHGGHGGTAIIIATTGAISGNITVISGNGGHGAQGGNGRTTGNGGNGGNGGNSGHGINANAEVIIGNNVVFTIGAIGQGALRGSGGGNIHGAHGTLGQNILRL